MKKGEYATVEAIQLSDSDKWYTLVHLESDSYGNIIGGTIRYIDKTEAGASRHNPVLFRENLIEDSVVIGGGKTVKEHISVFSVYPKED